MHVWTNLFNITALCFPHTVTNVLLIAAIQLVHPPFLPYHPLYPHTSAASESRGQEGVWRSARGEADEGDGSCRRTEGNSVSFKSMWERQRGQCVWPGRVSSISLSLTHFLALCPRSCFSLSLFALADTQWHLAAIRSPTCACADTHASHTHTQLCLFWHWPGAT